MAGWQTELSPDQQQFVTKLASATKISTAMVAAWVACESGTHVSGTKQGFNFLNVGPGRAYPNVDAAVTATVAVINQPNMHAIVAAAQAPLPAPSANQKAPVYVLHDYGVLAGLLASPWCSDKKGPGGKCAGYSPGGCIDKKYQQYASFESGAAIPGGIFASIPGLPNSVAQGLDSGVNAVTGAVGGGLSAIASIAGDLTKLFTWAVWKRVLGVVGGTILMFVGLYLMGKDSLGQVGTDVAKVAAVAA